MEFSSPVLPTNEEKRLAAKMCEMLDKKLGAGKELLGWIDWPKEVLETQLIQNILTTAKRLQEQSDVIVVVGIGGSYLGAKAVLDVFSNPFASKKVIFAGYTFDRLYHEQLLKYLNNVNYSCIIVSKSGTTRETKYAFEKLLVHAVRKYGEKAKKERFVTITDPVSGSLRAWTQEVGCESYEIPPNIGGRYSVFTACGLLPIACGLPPASLIAFVQGAAEMVNVCTLQEYEKNPAMQYALARYLLHTKENKLTEVLVSFTPMAKSIGDWRQQLFGESEGKEGKGILPICLSYSTDLHSMGQYIQDGPKNLFETFVWFDSIEVNGVENGKQQSTLVGNQKANGQEKDVDLNKICYVGTREAHTQGGIPVLERNIGTLTPYVLGQRLYCMMKACGISGYLLGVNPFDQPGVEAYKTAMKRQME